MTFAVLYANEVGDRLSDDWRSFAAVPDNLTSARVVVSEDRLAAIGTLRRNPLHPQPVHFTYLLADRSPITCLSLLLVELIHDVGLGSNDLVHITVNMSDEELVAWARREDFVQRMVTWQGRLSPHAMENYAPTAGLRCLADDDSPALRQALADLHDRIYRAAHTWNPPGDLVTERAFDLFMGDDLLPEYLWYAVNDDGEPIGVASLRLSDTPACVELGWIGTLPRVDAALNASLIDTALQAASGLNLLIEVDDNEAELIARLRQLPVVWESSCIRFERAVKTNSSLSTLPATTAPWYRSHPGRRGRS